jgi:hypothetical protein
VVILVVTVDLPGCGIGEAYRIASGSPVAGRE